MRFRQWLKGAGGAAKGASARDETGASARDETGARARDHHGLTAELARPVELMGRVETSGDMKDTMPPMALQRALAQAQSGLELVSVRLEDARPLGVANRPPSNRRAALFPAGPTGHCTGARRS